MNDTYPSDTRARDRWISDRRDAVSMAARSALDPRRAYAQWVEDELGHDNRVLKIATIFLTNRECPWHCLMCDLWKNTLTGRVPLGAIPMQIAHALEHLPPAAQVKLYNSGSFFDRQAIPSQDFPTIARQLGGFERVIVESHPSLIGESCLRFRDLLAKHGNGDLEIAMGLETADPDVLEKLNKRMTLDQFAAAADFLRQHGIALRVFILVQPPFMAPQSALHWAERSLDFAFDCGAGAAVLIPTRTGNGATDALEAANAFSPPGLSLLEAAADYGVALKRGRVFADLWDLERFGNCAHCFPAREARLRELNRFQLAPTRVHCIHCAGNA